MFPSPYGDYGSYLEGKKVKVFYHVTVSVPLRGLWFLSNEYWEHYLEVKRCFRPLTGIMVLILYDTNKRRFFMFFYVSVPLRGLWFLSD